MDEDTAGDRVDTHIKRNRDMVLYSDGRGGLLLMWDLNMEIREVIANDFCIQTELRGTGEQEWLTDHNWIPGIPDGKPKLRVQIEGHTFCVKDLLAAGGCEWDEVI
ncbi:WD repeat-containing protein 5B, partial [Striga asiatica]